MEVLLIGLVLDNYLVYPLYQPQEQLNSHRYVLQITPLCDEEMVDTRVAIEGVTCMRNSLVLLEACGNI